jgi:hypothetical protein
MNGKSGKDLEGSLRGPIAKISSTNWGKSPKYSVQPMSQSRFETNAFRIQVESISDRPLNLWHRTGIAYDTICGHVHNLDHQHSCAHSSPLRSNFSPSKDCALFWLHIQTKVTLIKRHNFQTSKTSDEQHFTLYTIWWEPGQLSQYSNELGVG